MGNVSEPFDFHLFEQRKHDHLKHALDPAHQSLSSLDRIQLIHEAIPDIDFSEISLETTRWNETVPTPLLISSMTAGHPNAPELNQTLATACAQRGWSLGVGSQRRQLHDPAAAQEWTFLNTLPASLSIFSNIGLSQLKDTSLAQCEALIQSIGAKAFIVHTNPLQEVLQKEGTPDFSGSWQALETLCEQLSAPIVVKETGCGFSSKTLKKLAELNVAAVELSGLGGTHWGRIEGARAVADSPQQRAAQVFQHWGISTVNSVQSAVALTPPYEIWASGGVRSGLDAAKLLAMGAHQVGFAQPALKAALQGLEALLFWMECIEYELKIALFCTGCVSVSQLRREQPWQMIDL